MKVFWKRIWEVLSSSHRFQIQTKLSQKRILQRVENVVCETDSRYTGYLLDNGFIIRFNPHGRNDMSPQCKATIREEEGVTTVDLCLSSRMLSRIASMILYLFMLFYIVLASLFLMLSPAVILYFTLLLGVHYVALFRPARRMKKLLIEILSEE